MATTFDPAEFGLVPANQGAQQGPAQASGPNASDYGLTPAPPQPPTQQPQLPPYPTATATGDLSVDLPRIAGTALVNAGSTALSPLFNAGKGISSTVNKLFPGYPGYSEPYPTTQEEAKANAFQTLGIPAYQPTSLGGRMGMAGLTTGVLAATDPAAIPSAIAGGAGSEYMQEQFPDHPLLASLLGFATGAGLTNKLANMPLAAGGRLDPDTAALANAAQGYGIRLFPNQVSNSAPTRFLYSQGAKLPFSGAGAAQDAQMGDVIRAATREMGENSDRLTPDVLTAASNRIGGVFNDVANRTPIPLDDAQLLGGLDNVSNMSKLRSADTADLVEKQIQNILKTGANNGGNIGGKTYQDLTAKGGPIDDMIQSNNSGTSYLGGQLRNVLDDALQRNAAPEDVAALQQARSQWKAYRTLQPLTLRADTVGGATPSTGVISPIALRAAVNQSYGDNVANAPLGAVPLNDLAKIAQRFLKEPNDSTTTTRSAMERMLETGGKVAAGALGAGAAEGVDPHILAGALATVLANRGAQSIMRMPGVTNRMVAASLNPNGFQFTYPWLAQGASLPFALAPPSATSTQTQP